jgi:hypothetical protein
MEFLQILTTLRRHNVRFIVVGAVGAVLQGAPINTFDLDIVHATDEDNVTALQAALIELDACFRVQRECRLVPDRSHLRSPGHQLLMTRYGPLDLLGSIGRGHTYEDLAPRAVTMETGAGPVEVLDLAALILIKEETAQEKDLAVLPVLRRTLERKRKRE